MPAFGDRAVSRSTIPCILLALAASSTTARGLAADETVERTVAGLDAAVNATWTRLPLLDWTTRVAALAGKPVILDRRIDPDRLVTRTARGEPLADVIRAVAEEAGATVEELPGTIRLVPASARGRAAAAADDLDRRLAAIPAPQRKPLVKPEPWRWPTGARPRDLVTAALAEAGLTVEGLDAIPHDHFPAAELPPLPLAERLDLVLAHFDLRILWSGDRGRPRGRIVAIDADLSPPPPRRPNPPDGSAAPRRPTTSPSRSVTLRDEFTLRLEAPLDQALAAIAARLGLELDLDQASLAARGIAPGEIVRAEVEKASRDRLLDAVLQPVGLQWKIEGQRLRVFAAEVPETK
jgi:hypothetical protein